MAPTRRSSSTTLPQKREADGRSFKQKPSKAAPLKSALKSRMRTPPGSRDLPAQTRHLRSELHAQQRIDHGKEMERKNLLIKAAESLAETLPGIGIVPMTPESLRSKKAVTFAESTKQPNDGEGHRLRATRMKRRLKRRHKRVKPASNPIGIVQDDILGSWEGLEMQDEIVNILTNPTDDVRLEDICIGFESLKKQIQYHCRDFYTYQRPVDDQSYPFFTMLKVRNRELFRYIQYSADGSQYGWSKLLTVANQRENLVYAIISRALFAYVFDVELFGASEDHEEELLKMCREYLNFDAFVRNKHRAQIVTRILLKNLATHTPAPENGNLDHATEYFEPATESLCRRLHTLIAPLLEGKSKNDAESHLSSLSNVIRTAVKIHIAIRLVGKNGTVFHFEHIAKHTIWDPTTMNCVNKLKMDLTAEHSDERLVKIPCFPAISAYVPSGPTLEDFEDKEFVRKWKEEADDQGSKPIITSYRIILADVVLENTPFDRPPNFLTLSQTMACEQEAMSDRQFHRLTGINRARNKRIFKFVRRAKKVVKHAAGLGVAATAGYLCYGCSPSVAIKRIRGANIDADLLRTMLARIRNQTRELSGLKAE